MEAERQEHIQAVLKVRAQCGQQVASHPGLAHGGAKRHPLLYYAAETEDTLLTFRARTSVTLWLPQSWKGPSGAHPLEPARGSILTPWGARTPDVASRIGKRESL